MNTKIHFMIAWLLIGLLAACIKPPDPAAMPTPDPAKKAEDIAGYRDVLARWLHVDSATIATISAERVDWPDSCLGVPDGMKPCVAGLFPGYKLVLRANHASYTLHTAPFPDGIRVAAAPEPQIGKAIITWRGSDLILDHCLESVIGDGGVAFARCGQPKIGGKFVSVLRQTELAEFARTFASFKAKTPRGEIQFSGTGTALVNDTGQQQLAEWAQNVTFEAKTGESLTALSYQSPTDVSSPKPAQCAVQPATITEARLSACAEARVFFLEPTHDATVTSPLVVAMDAENFQIEDSGVLHEGAGHFALLIDTSCLPPQTVINEDAQHLLLRLSQSAIVLRLPLGRHQLCLQAVDGFDKTLAGDQMSQVITVLVTATSNNRGLAAQWLVYQADSGYAIRYPLASYSVRRGITPSPEVFYPGVQVLAPNDAFTYREPRATTYQLSIAVSANSRQLSLDKPAELLASGQLLAFDPALLKDRTIQDITLGGEPALRVDDLAVGPTSITTLIVTIHHDRIYELLVEPYPLFSNQADMAQTEASSAKNAELIEQMIATFQFAGG